MKQEKRKRLEAAGWRVGTVSEFLGLSDEEAALIELKLDLARAVKTERIRRHLTQEELGSVLGSSQSGVTGLYRLVPRRRPQWREAMIGALTFSLLWVAAKLLFVIYEIGRAHV